MASSVKDVAREHAATLPEGSQDRLKLERMADNYDEKGLAKYLNDRGLLPDDLKHKYRLDRPGSNVTAGEIPEEAPEYTGDVGLAAAAGLKEDPLARSANADEDELPDEVQDYNDLTVSQLHQVINYRNDGRDEESQIAPDSDRKADLVAALEADDEEG